MEKTLQVKRDICHKGNEDMLLVKFFAENSTCLEENEQVYVEKICKNLYDAGLISNMISFDDLPTCNEKEAVVHIEDGIYFFKFEYSNTISSFRFSLGFEFGTYNCSSQFLIEISSDTYIPTPQDNYLEQLKLNIKKQIKRDWEKIVWLIDKDAACSSLALYPELYDVENLARQLISELMTKEYGLNWWERFVPIDIKEKHKARLLGYKKSVPNFNNIDERLLSIDITDLKKIFIIQIKKWEPASDVEIDKLLSELITISQDRLMDKLKARGTVVLDLWEQQFSKYLPNDFIERFDILTIDRNHVAHNKVLDRNIYSKMKALANGLKANLEKAILDVANLLISKEQRERIAYEQSQFIEEYKAIEKSIQESETNVKIRNNDEIIGFLNEYLMEEYQLILEALRFRLDIEISDILAIEKSNPSGILFTLTSKITEEMLELNYLLDLEDEPGADTIIKLFVKDAEDEATTITYSNGEIEFNEELGTYMPLVQDEVFVSNELVGYITDLISTRFINLREKVDADMYTIIKDGGESPILDLECCECGESYICIDETYAPMGVCLNCGAYNEIVKCDRCECFVEGSREDDEPFLCENCIEEIKEE